VSEYIAQYGYAFVGLWALLEGETVLLLAGFAVQQGQLNLWLILLIGTIGAFIGDQFWFHMARRHGRAWLHRRPHFVQRAETATRLLERHATLFILSFRFIYGMRNLGAMVIGLSGVAIWRFAVLNFIAALVWAVTVIMAGYLFGGAAVALLDDVASIEKLIIAVVAVVAVAIVASWVMRRWLLHRLRG
jgi:membrane protein DedA with SNARE-associated domain